MSEQKKYDDMLKPELMQEIRERNKKDPNNKMIIGGLKDELIKRLKDNDAEKYIVHNLKGQPMPNDTGNITSFRTQNKQQKKESLLASNAKDRRKKVEFGGKLSKLSNLSISQIFGMSEDIDGSEYIVHLFSDFNGDTYTGTGTVINIKGKTIYVLTAAHVVMDINEFENTSQLADNVWFKFLNKEISATKIYVYDAYKKKKQGNDLAVIECKTNISMKFYNEFPKLGIDDDCSNLAIVGYPADKKGELYYHYGRTTDYDRMNDYLSYRIDTTGGQSGSAISSVDHPLINGIHTDGDYLGQTKNYGTKFNPHKLKWIKDIYS